MIATATLTPVAERKHGQRCYRVSGVGQPPFWPHDGDTIRENDIAWLKNKKGWLVEIGEAAQ